VLVIANIPIIEARSTGGPSGRGIAREFVDLANDGLASMYTASSRSVVLRATMDISARASWAQAGWPWP
jgi:hypothetical protein